MRADAVKRESTLVHEPGQKLSGHAEKICGGLRSHGLLARDHEHGPSGLQVTSDLDDEPEELFR